MVRRNLHRYTVGSHPGSRQRQPSQAFGAVCHCPCISPAHFQVLQVTAFTSFSKLRNCGSSCRCGEIFQKEPAAGMGPRQLRDDCLASRPAAARQAPCTPTSFTTDPAMSVPSWSDAWLPSRSRLGLPASTRNSLSLDSTDSVDSYELVGEDDDEAAGLHLGKQRMRFSGPLHSIWANIAAAAKATPPLSCIVIVVLLVAVTCIGATLLSVARHRGALSQIHQLPAISEAQRNASNIRHATHEQCIEIYPGLYE